MKSIKRLKTIQLVVGLVLIVTLLAFMKTKYMSAPTDCAGPFLFSLKDSLKVVQIDFAQPKEFIEAQLRSQLRTADIGKPLKFGAEVGGKIYNASIHAPHFSQFACYGMPAMRHKSPQLEILMNSKHMLMLEGMHRMTIDSLAGFIGWYFPHDAPFGEKIVKLQCEESCAADKIENCISSIGEGYMRYYEKTALEKFNKNTCQLDSIQLKEVIKKYPFELRLWVGDPPVPDVPMVQKNLEVDI